MIAELLLLLPLPSPPLLPFDQLALFTGAVAEFVNRSDTAVNYTRLAANPTSMTVNDDVILGFWLSDAQRRRRLPNITYVFVNERATNLECDIQDCARHRICSMYKLPSNSSVLIHNLKAASMMVYVWAVIRGWATHNLTMCKRIRSTANIMTMRASLKPAHRWLASIGLPVPVQL